jgi:KipI family sensor histidine kinase inhibitor
MTPAPPARAIRAFGDSAVVVETDSVESAHALAVAINGAGLVGVEDVIVGFGSVTVVIDATVTDVTTLAASLASIAPSAPGTTEERHIEIPVTFDGPDLDEVARLAHMTPALVIELLLETELRVAFVGFAPGFAYLVGLPDALAAVPRRATPRPVVAAGSVALAGGFAGIYPQSSPGGWQVIGHTGRRLFDPRTAPYAALQAGDVIRFRLDDGDATTQGRAAETGEHQTSMAGRHLVVEEPGLLSFVQDGGRRGVAGLGVPRAGAADQYALRMANRLVGNDEDASAIEITVRGPTLRFACAVHVAVIGDADVRIDGHSVAANAVVPVDAGQMVTVGTLERGLRGYLAVSGGIDVPAVLGSRSTDVLSHLGPGALAGGDVLGLGPPGRPRGRLRPVEAPVTPTRLRVVVGPDEFPADTLARFVATAWEVDSASDRIGVRLRAQTLPTGAGAESGSRGMVTGAVQLPPDGRPIVLLCDHATVGGYPVIATVASADLGLLGQLAPGDTVGFVVVDLGEAVRARAQRELEVHSAVDGWYPVRSD